MFPIEWMGQANVGMLVAEIAYLPISNKLYSDGPGER